MDGLTPGGKRSSQEDFRTTSNESTQDFETPRESLTGSPWQVSSQGKGAAGSSKRPLASSTTPTLRELRAAAAGTGSRSGLASASASATPSSGALKPTSQDSVAWTRHEVNESGDGSGPDATRAASSHGRTMSNSSLSRNDALLVVTPAGNDGPQTARLPSKNSGVGLGIDERNTAPSSAPPSTNSYGAREAESARRAKTSTEQNPSFAPRSRSGSKASQTLSPPSEGVSALHGSPKGNSERLSKAFSFYDPDFVNLMDSFGKFGDGDETALEAARKSPGNKKSPLAARSPHKQLRDLAPTRSAGPAALALRAVGEEGSSSADSHAEVELEERKEDDDDLRGLHSPRSADNARARVRESIREARDGRMDVDTAFVEAILNDLDETKERMKSLQHRYDRMKVRSGG